MDRKAKVIIIHLLACILLLELALIYEVAV